MNVNTRTRKRRREMNARERRVVAWIFGTLAVFFGAGAVLFAVLEVHARSDANAYSSAPVCASVGPTASSGCRRVESAVIDSVTVKSGKSPRTDVTLTVAGDSNPRSTQIAGTVAGGFTVGEPVTVTLWHNKIALVSDSSRSLDSEDGPGWEASNDAMGTFFMILFSAAWARAVGWLLFEKRVVRRRFALADVFAGALVAAVGGVYLAQATTAGLCLVVITVTVLAVSVTVWPRLSQVRRTDLFSDSEQPSDAVIL